MEIYLINIVFSTADCEHQGRVHGLAVQPGSWPEDGLQDPQHPVYAHPRQWWRHRRHGSHEQVRSEGLKVEVTFKMSTTMVLLANDDNDVDVDGVDVDDDNNDDDSSVVGLLKISYLISQLTRIVLRALY